MPENKSILNDVRELRKRANDAQYRNFRFEAKKDHIRLVYGDEVSIPNTSVLDELRDLGYQFAGAHFGSNMLAFEPSDD